MNIAERFAVEGYELLTEYINNKTHVNLRCPNGDTYRVRPDRFFNKTKARCTCEKCKGVRKKPGKTMRTPEEFARLLDEKGYRALETVKRMRDKALLECKECGYTTRKNVQSVIDADCGCAQCNGNARLTTEVFSRFVNENARGYTLTSEVKGSFKKARICCDKGHEFEMNPADFMNKDYRCPTCKFIKMSGEGHWNYNPNLTEEERETMRAFPGYTAWQFEVKKRDKFTCQCCEDKRGGNLVSHHLDGWDNFKDKRLDVGNGVTLCDDCHKNFHHQYGYGGNTKIQYDEWIASADNSRRFLYAKKEAI